MNFVKDTKGVIGLMVGNVMVIDDSSIDRKVISQILKNRLDNINVFESEDGLDIVNQLVKNNIHVCILDILMPLKDGFQVLEEIKEDPSVMDIPVIVCTGIEDKQAIEKALMLGAYDYFSKPLSEEAMKISLPLKIKNAIEFMKRKEEIIYLSYHDKLTGLYNRRFCEEEMKRLDTERNLPISLIVGDVNGLKLTNDAFGHEAGDRLLITIADILKKQCREDEIVARTGGDEFIIVLPKTTITDAEKIIDRIKKECAAEKEDPIKPSISMGSAAKENVDQDMNTIYKAAEEKMYNTKVIESKSIRSEIIFTLKKTLHQRDYETAGHSNRIMSLAQRLGKALNLSSDQLSQLTLLSGLHDIGISAIPEPILSKRGDLMPEEERILKSHSEIGYRIANSSPDLVHIASDILSHHERWDGSGYPQGLSGETIPLNARIISILHTYDTMVYGGFKQEPVPQHEALEYIKRNAGKAFDPKMVDIFIKLVES